MDGRSYKVIPQVAREFRLQPDMLKDYYIRPASGELVNLAAGVSSTDLARDLDAAPLVPLVPLVVCSRQRPTWAWA